MTYRRSFRLVVLALCLVVGAGLCRAQTPGRVQEKAPAVIPLPRAEPVVPPSPAKGIAAMLNDAFVSVFERVAPAVVIIDVTKKPTSDGEGNDVFHEFFFHPGPDGGDGSAPDGPNNSRRPKPQSEGSGFVIQSGGYILTNNHVVTGADRITVKLKDGRQFPAKLTGADEKTDIAVVKIEATDLPVEELADSDGVRVGELACAIGVPYNLDYTFTTGVVSAKGRNKLGLGSDDYEDYIQTDASINPGNSGGPLVNLDGKVIGMNTLINGLNRGLGFAIPSNMLREVGDQIIHSGRVIRPYIGVRIVSVDDDTPDRFGGVFNGVRKGVIVQTIMPESPASKSDLRPVDVITEVDGVAVSTDRDLQKQILSKKVGSTVQLSVLRKGKNIKVPVTTAELPVEVARNNPNTPGAGPDSESQKQEAAQFGMQLQDLNKELATNLGVTANNGVVVTSVAEDSPAARASINIKDVITAVDDRPVRDVVSFKEAAKAGDQKRGIVCYLERPAGKSFVVIKGD